MAAKLARTPIIRTPVVSSNIAAIGYDADTETLEVEFVSGALYRYQGVPADAYQALMNAKSIGSHFSARIRLIWVGAKIPDVITAQS
jgi:hypothetical protein